MRIPNRILEHPIEAAIASLLLLALLFVSQDPAPSSRPAPSAQMANAQQMYRSEKSVRRPERSFCPLIIIPERTSDPERPQPLRQPASGVRSLPKKPEWSR